ncbi:MAG: zinc dependent phospholipase C family protein [Acidimicrobiia bacterium]
MPSHLVHIQLTQTLLDSPRHRPRWVGDEEALNALYHGALGPDMGYFPGVDPLLSGLAHYVCPVRLARALLDRASTPVEEAYAWGWLTHVLADAQVHQHVNRVAGLIDHGSADLPSTPSDSVAAHVMVEVGLDAQRMVEHPGSERIRLRPVFDRSGIGFIAGAYAETYDLEFEPSTLLAAHLAVVRYQPILFRFLWLMGRRQAGRYGVVDLAFLPALMAVRASTAVFARRSLLYGATHPLPPPEWFLAQVEEVFGSFAAVFYSHLAEGLAALPELNLDTGEPEDPDHPYPPAEEARAELTARLRGAS